MNGNRRRAVVLALCSSVLPVVAWFQIPRMTYGQALRHSDGYLLQADARGVVAGTLFVASLALAAVLWLRLLVMRLARSQRVTGWWDRLVAPSARRGRS